MTDIDKKREEIREGLVNVVKPYMIRGLYSGWDYPILKYLYSRGVVIVIGDTSWDDIKAVEPLIERE